MFKRVELFRGLRFRRFFDLLIGEHQIFSLGPGHARTLVLDNRSRRAGIDAKPAANAATEIETDFAFILATTYGDSIRRANFHASITPGAFAGRLSKIGHAARIVFKRRADGFTGGYSLGQEITD